MQDWRIEHNEILDQFLSFLNKDSANNTQILKGGTALFKCYNLNRFSENIDLDGTEKRIIDIVKNYCEQHNYKYRIAKDTPFVQRLMIDYNNKTQPKPLKVEVSYRVKDISENDITNIKGLLVYKIDMICLQKCRVYTNRDKLRDLYDLTYIANNYYSELSSMVKATLQDTIAYRGIEHFEYLLETQSDELIDIDFLIENYIKMQETFNWQAEATFKQKKR